MYIISNEKDFMNFKERNEVYMVGFKGNKGSKKWCKYIILKNYLVYVRE